MKMSKMSYFSQSVMTSNKEGGGWLLLGSTPGLSLAPKPSSFTGGNHESHI